MTAEARLIRRRPASPPIYLLDVEADAGHRTGARGVLWEGPLNASPEDTTDGPSPVEALLAGVASCFIRNVRWIADGSRVELTRLRLRLAAVRDDDPPAITEVRLEVEIEAEAPRVRVAGIVERALRTGTITRTVARGARLDVAVLLNGEPLAVRVPEWRRSG